MTSDYTYTNLDRARDAVANSDWQDIGRTDPYTIASGYAFFDRVIRQVKADTLREAAEEARYQLGTEASGHTSTYSVRKWLNERANQIQG